MTVTNRSHSGFTSANIADAALRLGTHYFLAPPGLKSVVPFDTSIVGAIRPVRHSGSVDIFFEALDRSKESEILVVDNQARLNEGCIGDLIVAETKRKKLKAIIIWGAHRDTHELISMKFPVFSYGSFPSGPLADRRREDNDLTHISFGNAQLDEGHGVIVDRDGAVFYDRASQSELFKTARQIAQVEGRQRKAIEAGIGLDAQLGFEKYLQERKVNPQLSFRAFLRRSGGEIEQ